jgi:16S rRNA (guanine527-N7)-methyltransferase
VENISIYFPELTRKQHDQFALLNSLYSDWNSKINVVSRKDISMLSLHHVLHSLAIAKVISFAKETSIIDIGTGGGFPGIPLAILFPTANFTLVDSIGKKILVVQSIAQALGLENVTAIKARVEDITEKFDFALCRAVAPLTTLMEWTKRVIRIGGCNNLPNGLIALKGGDINNEFSSFRKVATKWNISNFFDDEYFIEKYVIFVPRM